jgi:hypothetical protein
MVLNVSTLGTVLPYTRLPYQLARSYPKRDASPRVQPDGRIRCCRCRQVKDYNDYAGNSRRSLPTYCRVCAREARQENRRVHDIGPRRRRPAARDGLCFCMRGDGHWAPREAFYINAFRSDGVNIYCAGCHSILSREKRAARTIAQGEGLSRARARCECGRQKVLSDDACERCLILDGTDREAAIIAALRLLGGHGTTDVIAHTAHYSRRHVLRLCAKLLRRKRVVRREEDTTLAGNESVIWSLVS